MRFSGINAVLPGFESGEITSNSITFFCDQHGCSEKTAHCVYNKNSGFLRFPVQLTPMSQDVEKMITYDAPVGLPGNTDRNVYEKKKIGSSIANDLTATSFFGNDAEDPLIIVDSPKKVFQRKRSALDSEVDKPTPEEIDSSEHSSDSDTTSEGSIYMESTPQESIGIYQGACEHRRRI